MRKLACLLCCFLWACGGAPRNPELPVGPETVIDMDAMVITASGGEVTGMFDAQSLYEEAQQAYSAKDYETCVQNYERLREFFPDSHYLAASLYNEGMCHEKLKAFDKAQPLFERYVELAAQEKDRNDGLFHKAYCLSERHLYQEALDLYRDLLKKDLSPSEQAELLLRRGAVYLGMEEFSAAERDLRKSINRVQEIYADYLRGNDLLAEGYYLWGRIYQTLSHRAELKASLDQLEGMLAEKIRRFKQAQRHYISAISVQHPEISAAAGFQLGDLYEEFAEDVYAVQPPADFDQETRDLYFAKLRSVLKPVFEESIDIYQKNIAMIDRLGDEGGWRELTEQRLNRLIERLAEFSGENGGR